MSDPILYQGNFLTMRYVEVEGREYEYIGKASAVVLIPQVTSTAYLIGECRRPATGRNLWEFPAGHIDTGESPLSAANRELQEETGYVSGKSEYLWSAYSSPGFSDEMHHFFLMSHLRLASTPEAELLQTRVAFLPELLEMWRKGEIMDGKTIQAVLWLALRGKLEV